MNNTHNTSNSHIEEKIDSDIRSLLKNIEDLDRYIQKNTDADNESSHMYKFDNLIINITKIVKEYLNMYSLKAKNNILINLENLHEQLIGIKKHLDASTDRKFLSYYYGSLAEVLNLPRYYKSQEYKTDLNLNNEELNEIFNEIKLRYPTISISTELIDKYNTANENEKKSISSKLILLHNEVVKPKNEYSSEFIDNIANNLNLTISSIGLSDQLQKINNSSEILNQVNSEVSAKSIKAIESGYNNEAQKLRWPICILNIVIILIFLIIIFVISLKFYAYFIHIVETTHKPQGLVKFFLEIGKSPSDFIFFFSLIFSISALETYLIKERNRLIKLRDYFLFCDLELTSMPQYMRELDLDQRQNLYIDLSKNYFKGGIHEDNQKNNETDNVSDVLKKIEELSKIVKELKN